MQELFSDTKTAFRYKSSHDLRLTKWIFGLMHNYPELVLMLSKLGMNAVEWKLPFANRMIYHTFYKVFCGGVNLEDCKNVVQRLDKYGVKTVLDYGAEAKDSEDEYENVTIEFLKAIRFASGNSAITIISVKVTAIADFDLLHKYSEHDVIKSTVDQEAWTKVEERFERICEAAYEGKVSVFVDAEESWVQEAIDELVLAMMKKYNHSDPIIYNTYQMYLKSSYERLVHHHTLLQKDEVILGAKIVRGAYMEKEAERAAQFGIENPIQPSKQHTDDAFNEAIDYSFEHYEEIAFCCASHNEESSLRLFERVKESGLQKHPHIMFCQLYGMRDNITFNLAKHGVLTMKYLPYGSVENTFPYLVRRANENTSITSDASKEYVMLKTELDRREI